MGTMVKPSHARPTIRILASVLIAPLLVSFASADIPGTHARSIADNRTTSSTSEAKTETREAERVVQDLVQSHLPELANVLKQLRKVQPEAYERAIKDLFKAARKLELAEKRDQRLFEIEVELLQAEYQASLLMAKLKVRDSESGRQKLRDAAARLQQAQISRTEYDVDVLRRRLERAQKQLDSAVNRLESRKNDADAQLERSFQTMLRKAGRDAQRRDSKTQRPDKPQSNLEPKPNRESSIPPSTNKPR
jgi:hypothetical protein